MANIIKKINVNGTEYTIVDETALPKKTTSGNWVYTHTGGTQNELGYASTFPSSATTTTLVTASAINELILYCGTSTVNIFTT